MSDRAYPDHIYDPVRVGIASKLVEKELLKLLPSLDESVQAAIRKDVENWFGGKESGLAAVQDFWNGFDGITRNFKLKRFLPFLTAANVRWKRVKVPVDALTIKVHLPVLEEFGQPPYPAGKLRKALVNPDTKRRVKENSDHFAAYPVQRDDFPIVVAKYESGMDILDGARRTIRALVYDREVIDAWVGTPLRRNRPRDYWVTTSYLRDLIRISDDRENRPELREVSKQALAVYFAESEVAKTTFRQRCMHPGSAGERLGKELGL